MTAKGMAPEVFVSRVRRRTLTHAFEQVLEDARGKAASEGHADEVRRAGDAEDAAQKFQSTLEALAEHPDAEGRVSKIPLAAAHRYDMGEAKVAPAKAANPVKPMQEKSVRTPEPRPDPRRAAAALNAKLGGNPGIREITSLRRQFALANHPDRVPEDLRAEAAEVMADVNARIDQALKRARKK